MKHSSLKINNNAIADTIAMKTTSPYTVNITKLIIETIKGNISNSAILSTEPSAFNIFLTYKTPKAMVHKIYI